MIARRSREIHEGVTRHLSVGRALGLRIDCDPSEVDHMSEFPPTKRLAGFGIPGRNATSLADRCLFYSALGYVDPTLAFAAPGPGMAGILVEGLADDEQKKRFYGRFKNRLTWSFFAMTERCAGTDTGGLSVTARRNTPGGDYILDGEKYLIGHGWRAQVGVVFARTGAGPLGLNAFLLDDPKSLRGLTVERLEMVGCRGANLSRLVFKNARVPKSSLLGGYIQPTQRFSHAASATFDAMRPCVASVAIGMARAAIDQAEEETIIPLGRMAAQKIRLDALQNRAVRLCEAADRGDRLGREAGVLKVQAVSAATSVVNDVVSCARHVVGPPAWLCKWWRDAGAFEYAEGVSALHRLNGAELFQGGNT